MITLSVFGLPPVPIGAGDSGLRPVVETFQTRLHLQGKVARRAIVFNNLAQIMQSCTNPAISQIRNRHMRHVLNTHEHQFDKTHLTELDEMHRNRPKSNFNLAKKTIILERYIRQTDRDSHFYLVLPCRSRTQ